MNPSATFWDKRATNYDNNIQAHDAQYDKTITHTKSFLKPTDKVLDFGCASGEMTLDLVPFVERIHGIDISAKMIELATQKAEQRRIHRATFSQMDVFHPQLVPGSFSAILAFNVFHLVEDAPKVLARLHDLLDEGGLLITQTPCLGERNLLFRTLINFAQKTGMAPAITSFTTPDLEALVKQHQFDIVESKLWDKAYATRWIVAQKA